MNTELRNRIYVFVSNNGPIILVPSDRAHQKKALNGMCFTHVCRQIRSEYRPIWLREMILHIHWEDFKRLTSLFYSKEQYPSELIVYLHKDDYYFTKCDIMPLFLMSINHKPPNIIIEGFDDSFPAGWNEEDARSLELLLNSKNSTWLSDLHQGRIQSISIIIDRNRGDDLHVHIQFTQGYAFQYSADMGLDEAVERYFSDTGLKALAQEADVLKLHLEMHQPEGSGTDPANVS